jgi:tRNA U38,U39,U40 pseudouridine synthase TruA
VWGFGTVIKSTHPKIQEGERIYGYLAPTRYLLLPVSPNDVNKFSFYIPRPHLPAGEHFDSNTN